MNNLAQIQKRLLVIIPILLLLLLGLGIWGFVKSSNEKKAIQAMILEAQNNKEIPDEYEEENIEHLIAVIPGEEKEEPENGNAKEEEEKNNSQQQTTKNNKNTYYIKVNYQANVVTIYTKDSSGNYTVPYKAMVCSAGISTPTSGVYPIQYRWRWLSLVGGVYGQYSTQIVGNILFHSVPYTSKSQDSLEYWEYDKLGTFASAGCIRLTVQDALWIYNNIPKGTEVEFYASSNPGPLRKAIRSKNLWK